MLSKSPSKDHSLDETISRITIGPLGYTGYRVLMHVIEDVSIVAMLSRKTWSA
jgi:hypothetical protein